MYGKREQMTATILNPLRTTWEDMVATGLRDASDVELLWMLDEIEAQLGGRGTATARSEFGDPLADIPDWDDKSPEELDAIARELETDGEACAAPPGQILHRPERSQPRGKRKRAAWLGCEELEPRFPPSAAPWLVFEVCTSQAALTVPTFEENPPVPAASHHFIAGLGACETESVWMDGQDGLLDGAMLDDLAYALVA